MLAYKSEWFGKTFVTVPPAYTSQTCSVCGWRKKLELKDREWTCSECGEYHDRDVNAAKNILAKGLDLLNTPGGIKKKPVKRIGSMFGRRKKKKATMGDLHLLGKMITPPDGLFFFNGSGERWYYPAERLVFSNG